MIYYFVNHISLPYLNLVKYQSLLLCTLVFIDGFSTLSTLHGVTGCPTPEVLLRISMPYFVQILYGVWLHIKTLLRLLH